jgi:hypothetical protein
MHWKCTNTFNQVIFFWVAIDPRHDSGVKRASCSAFRGTCQVASSVKAKCTNADDVRTRLRHTPLMLLLRQSRQVSNIIYAVSVVNSPNDVIIIHTHTEVMRNLHAWWGKRWRSDRSYRHDVSSTSVDIESQWNMCTTFTRILAKENIVDFSILSNFHRKNWWDIENVALIHKILPE